jgi:NACHT domain
MDPSKNRRQCDKLLSLLPLRPRGPSSSPSTPATTGATPGNPSNVTSSGGAHGQAGATSTALHPSAQQLTSIAYSSQTLLTQALKLLSDQDRARLRPLFSSTNSDIGTVLEDCYTEVTQKQQKWRDKRWAFTFAGRKVVLKEEVDKIASWLNRVKDIGDLVAGADPVHAGLPWAGVRTLLQVLKALSHQATLWLLIEEQILMSGADQMAALVVGCETVLYMVNRLKTYMKFWMRLPPTQERTNFENALTRLHAHILTFLALALRKYQQSSFRRTMTALWDEGEILDFEDKCGKLGGQLDAVAADCDRALADQDRGTLQGAVQQLHDVLTELKQIHYLHATLKRVEQKIDLGQLRVVEGASFDSYGQTHECCHPDTRRDLLEEIQRWTQQPDAPTIFWLNGMAGTGKSTISWTVTKRLSSSTHSLTATLGASFFFKRGEGDRGSAALLFPTLADQLATRISGFGELLAQAISDHPRICSKALGEQFKRLLDEPLQKLGPDPQRRVFVVVVDALDECEKEEDMRTILQLWSTWSSTASVRLRLFVTSRPEVPIRRGFRNIFGRHQDLILHEVPRPIVHHDILTYLKSAFAEIRKEYNGEPLGGCLDDDWPGEDVLSVLTDMAVPLFIVAATIYRFIYRSTRPKQRLEKLLTSHEGSYWPEMAQVYVPVLQAMIATTPDDEIEEACRAFQTIVGSIISLAEPLSPSALADLLGVSLEEVNICLRPLHAVLQVSANSDTLVRPLHLSFGEYLTNPAAQTEKFGVDRAATHTVLWRQCLQLLNGVDGLRQNLCGLHYPGQKRVDLSVDKFAARLPLALRYACRYWVHHLKMSPFKLSDNDEVHAFLRKHFLHWLEALSLLDRLADAIEYVTILQSKVVVSAA